MRYSKWPVTLCGINMLINCLKPMKFSKWPVTQCEISKLINHPESSEFIQLTCDTMWNQYVNKSSWNGKSCKIFIWKCGPFLEECISIYLFWTTEDIWPALKNILKFKYVWPALEKRILRQIFTFLCEYLDFKYNFSWIW